jgi:hypothetical protein
MKIKDVLTLSDNNNYVVASIADYDNKTYLCLVDINNNDNKKYCYLNKDEIIIIEKENINEIVLLKLMNNMVKSFIDKK